VESRAAAGRAICQATGPSLPPWQVAGAPWPPPPKAKGKGGGRGGGLGGGGAWVGSMHHPLGCPPKDMLKLEHFSISFGDFSFFCEFFSKSN
jgi:hypothetical protein